MAERTNEEWLAELDFRRLGVEEGSEGLEFLGEDCWLRFLWLVL